MRLRFLQSAVGVAAMVAILSAGAAQGQTKQPAADAPAPGTRGTGEGTGTPPAAKAPFTVISLDPSRGRITNTLPFDEPFIVSVPVVKTDNTLHEIIVSLKSARSIVGEAFDCDVERTWDAEAHWVRRFASADAETASVVVPALEPNLFYHLCVFRLTDPGALGVTDADLAPEIREAVFATVRKKGESIATGFTTADRRAFQRAMIQAVRRVTPNTLRLRIGSGTALDTLSEGYAARAVILAMGGMTNVIAERKAALESLEHLVSGTASKWAAAASRIDQKSARAITDSAAAIRRRVGDAWTPADIDTIRARLDSVARISTVPETAGLDQALNRAAATLFELRKTSDLIADRDITPLARSSMYFATSSIGSLLARAKNRIGLDLGVASTWTTGKAAPYVGLNFYSRPVSTVMPLGLSGGLRRRVSLGLGITMSSIQKSSREDILNANSLLLSVGYRVWDAVRVSAGAVPYRLKQADPVTGKTSARFTWFLGLSADNDIKSALGDVYTKLFGGTPSGGGGT